MQANASLKAGFLVGGNDELIAPKGLVLPVASIEVPHPPGFLGEMRVAGEDPTAMLPGPNGIGVQTPPDRRATDLCNDPSKRRPSE